MLSTDPVRGRGLGWPLTPPPDPGPPDCAQTACRSKRGVLGHCCYCASPLLHPIDTGYSPLLWFATRGAMAAAFVRLGGHRAVPVPLTYTVEEAKRAVEVRNVGDATQGANACAEGCGPAEAQNPRAAPRRMRLGSTMAHRS